jgi:cell division protein FtsB
MGQAYETQKQRIQNFTAIFLMLLFGYLMFHLCLSQRSIPSLITLSAQEQILDHKLATIETEMSVMNDRVARLRPDTLDHDLLAEQAVKMLGKTSGNSVILLDNRS